MAVGHIKKCVNRDVVVIGASAGGIEALKVICGCLPASLQAAVLVVLHTSTHADGMIPPILGHAGPLDANYASDGQRLEHGRIYVAPSDHHLIVDDGELRIYRGPRENRHRPAIDPTFRSAAMSYGRRVIGVILTGLLDDGTSGLMVVRARKGVAIVQDPATALFPEMPTNALLRVPDAIVASLEGIGTLIGKFVSEHLEPAPAQSLGAKVRSGNPGARRKAGGASGDQPDNPLKEQVEAETEEGKPSQFACPECGGVLWEIDQQSLLRFRCRVGHAYTADYLQSEQSYAVEAALWAALRALEESAALYNRMAQRALDEDGSTTHSIFVQRSTDAKSNAEILRNFLLTYGKNPAEAEGA